MFLSKTSTIFGAFRLFQYVTPLLLTTQVTFNSASESVNTCRLWLAPSNLASEKSHKFGLFAGVDFAENEIIPDYEVGFPMIDFLQNPAIGLSQTHRETAAYLEAMMWLSDYAGPAKWEANASTTIMIPGVGVLANYHTGLSNVDWYQYSGLGRDPYIPSQETNAGRGSITPYYNFTVKATVPIKAGMELFSNFGIVATEDITNEFQDKIIQPDYELADKVLDKILLYFEKFGDKMSFDLQDDVLDFMLETILKGAAGKRARIIRSLIPAHPRKLNRVKEAGGTFMYRYKDMVKSPDWLEKHGLCVDNLEAKPSTIPHAGRGAFAKRDFRAGQIISPVPMVPIPTGDIFDQYEPVEVFNPELGVNELRYDTTKTVGYQQILNYCFGHPESSLLMMPASPMVSFINHGPLSASTASNNDGKPANAYLEWSQHDDIYNDHNFHDTPLNEWVVAEVPSIVMNVVAFRDIKEGEEILIDYGPDWELAWSNYVAEWQMKYNETGRTSKWPRKAQDTLALYKKKPFPFDIKQGMAPYPQGIVTGCYLVESPDDVQDGQARKNEHGHDILNWQGPSTEHGLAGQGLTVCDVVDRIPIYDQIVTSQEEGLQSNIVSYNYTVITRLKEANTDEQNVVQVQNIPHFAITLIDRPYTSDIHIAGAFRHWIGIDDKMFPQAWRNLRD